VAETRVQSGHTTFTIIEGLLTIWPWFHLQRSYHFKSKENSVWNCFFGCWRNLRRPLKQ